RAHGSHERLLDGHIAERKDRRKQKNDPPSAWAVGWVGGILAYDTHGRAWLQRLRTVLRNMPRTVPRLVPRLVASSVQTYPYIVALPFGGRHCSFASYDALETQHSASY
ncbi:unnamed protein product, partial [Ectocarpus sp. 13 AM-2016]